MLSTAGGCLVVLWRIRFANKTLRVQNSGLMNIDKEVTALQIAKSLQCGSLVAKLSEHGDYQYARDKDMFSFNSV